MYAPLEIGRHFEWSHYPVLSSPPERFEDRDHWKVKAVVKLLEILPKGEKVVWLDDDAHHMLSLVDVSLGQQTTVVAPDSSVGVTKSELEAVKRFLAE
jgi:hypothetical protein